MNQSESNIICPSCDRLPEMFVHNGDGLRCGRCGARAVDNS